MTRLRVLALVLPMVTTSCGSDDLVEDSIPMLPACSSDENVVFYDSGTSYPSAEEAIAAAQQYQDLDELVFSELSERVWTAGDPSDIEARIEVTPPADGDGWFISSVTTCV